MKFMLVHLIGAQNLGYSTLMGSAVHVAKGLTTLDLMYAALKGNPVHVAPAWVGSREGSDHFRSYVRNLSLHFCKRLFNSHDHSIFLMLLKCVHPVYD
jgi:hypothetical protein